jgi:PTH1 family peptidyl-tRNA hydrolase
VSLRLIVGLGNPGPKYAKTRHNVGVWLLQELAAKYNLSFSLQSKFSGQIAHLTLGEHSFWLLIPSTFMNESGRSVQALANFYKIPPEEILVAHDELDFPAGEVRLKLNGGHGGHNGLRDIIQCMGSNQFYRLRIGIDHPGHRDQVTPYVLGEPSSSDRNKIMQAIQDSLAVIPDLLVGDTESAFRYLHNK